MHAGTICVYFIIVYVFSFCCVLVTWSWGTLYNYKYTSETFDDEEETCGWTGSVGGQLLMMIGKPAKIDSRFVKKIKENFLASVYNTRRRF